MATAPNSSKRAVLSLAGKSVVAALSAGTALVSIITFARSYGLIGAPAPAALTVGDLGATWVGLSPAVDTATAIGDTIHLAATVTDKNGTALIGATITWSTDNPRVATVISGGRVIARASGVATITATVGDLLARSRVVVRQLVDTVRIGGDSAIAVAEGDRFPLDARGIDANGHPVPRRAVRWRTSDSAVAYVDSSGAVVGASLGKAVLTATVDTVSGQIPVRVIALPGSVAALSGDGQRAPAGSALGQPVVVRVLSRRGRPLDGVTVHFHSPVGAGSARPADVETDADGRARTIWTLGEIPGAQHLFAAVDGVDSAAAITSEADPVAANTRLAALADHQTGAIDDSLPQPIGIRVTDSTGRPLVGVPVGWLTLDGGAVAARSERTDSLGQAFATWTLGGRAGTQRVRAHVGSGRLVPPLTLVASATPGPAAVIRVASGDDQRGTVGHMLAKSIVLDVTDRGGNPVRGSVVLLDLSAGSVPDSAPTVRDDGTVRIRWTLGHDTGDQRLIARLDGGQDSVVIGATARAGSPANLAFDEAPDSASAGTTITGHLTLTDVYGNPIGDARLSLRAHAGSVSPSRTVTDAKGRATVKWKLSAKPGEQKLGAWVPNTDVETYLIVQAVEPHGRAATHRSAKHPPARHRP